MLLRPIDEAAAEDIVAGGCPAGLRGAPDYPADGDRIAARMFLERCASGADPRPFGTFVVCLEDDAHEARLAIGGIGFHAGVDPLGRVEIGYGITPSHRGRGHAKEALRLLIEHARDLEAATLTAQTEVGNPARAASEAVLLRHGFARTQAADHTAAFELELRSPRNNAELA